MVHKIAIFNQEDIEQPVFEQLQNFGHQIIPFSGSPTVKRLLSLPSDTEIMTFCTQVAIDETLLSYCPGLKFLSTRSTGYQHIDTNYLAKRGIALANCQHYCDESVAEHAIMLMLNLLKEMGTAMEESRLGRFTRTPAQMGLDLVDQTVGLWGLGATGLATLKRLKAFGCKIIVCARKKDEQLASTHGFQYVPFEKLIQESDILSLHVPMNAETRHAINEERLEQMKRGAMLINVARAGLVDYAALYEAVDSGHLSGAGIDVLNHEAIHLSEKRFKNIVLEAGQDHVAQGVLLERLLMQHPRIIVTPHTAYYTHRSMKAMALQTVDNIQAWLNKKPIRRIL